MFVFFFFAIVTLHQYFIFLYLNILHLKTQSCTSLVFEQLKTIHRNFLIGTWNSLVFLYCRIIVNCRHATLYLAMLVNQSIGQSFWIEVGFCTGAPAQLSVTVLPCILPCFARGRGKFDFLYPINSSLNHAQLPVLKY